MSDALFSSVELDSPGRAGFRLHQVEVFNWGTFDKRVWRLTLGGDTSLLTGDIGSGKSTLVDAITTLLLPAHRISYNKAAGAESKERTLRSYVEGHFKSERNEATGTSRPVGLRDHRSYSVILGIFVNEGYDETVSLAQVFHQRDRAGQPDRFFVTSTKPLSIEADFTEFGSDLLDLRRRLREGGASIENSFPDYSRQLRRLLGIVSDQAMELFHQTVSMKSVGNLNEFVRNHMLEPVDTAARIKGIVDHFEDLTKAHEAVTRARDQLEALTRWWPPAASTTPPSSAGPGPSVSATPSARTSPSCGSGCWTRRSAPTRSNGRAASPSGPTPPTSSARSPASARSSSPPGPAPVATGSVSSSARPNRRANEPGPGRNGGGASTTTWPTPTWPRPWTRRRSRP